MTKQQLIRLILDAAATGKLEDAEKAIDEYVKEFWEEKINLMTELEPVKPC